MALLEVKDLCRSFGGVRAVNGVSFSVEQGTIKALIGPNGAGKTTLFNLVSGYLGPDSGTVHFGGNRIHGLKPYQVARMGLSRTYQHTCLFPKMSAIENVMVGRHVRGRAGIVAGMLGLPAAWKEERETREKVLEIMDFTGIGGLAEMDASGLSFGQQRAVELSRALALEPRLLLLDEPAAGLNMRETADISVLIRKIRDAGVTVLIVEHDMSLVMNISDEVMVLSYGRKIAEGAPLEIQKNRDVVQVYLGEEHAQN